MWRHNGTPDQNLLDAYWDAVVTGANDEALAQAAANVDPNLTEAIAQARALHRRHRPDPAFARQLETTLMNAFGTTAIASPVLRPGRPKRIVTAPEWLPSRESLFPRRWSLAPIATVLLVAVTIAALLFANFRNNGNQGLIPASPDASPSAATPADVPMYRGNAARTGEMPGPGPAGEPDILWRFQTNGEIHSIPAFANGVLYGGSDDGYLYAIDGGTGVAIWQWFANGPVFSPAVVDGTVYVGAWDSNVYAIDSATGKERWHASGLGDNSSPAVVDGVVYVGSDDGFVSALNASDGVPIWETTLPAAIFHSVSIAEGKVFAGAEDGDLYALDLATGEQVWSFATGFEEAQTAAIADGVVYVTGQSPEGLTDVGTAFALDAADGSELWRFATDTRIKFSAAEISNGTVFLGDEAGALHAIDAATGTVQWTFQADTADPLSGLPAMVDGVLYVGGSKSTLYAIDMATGERRWQLNVGEPIVGAVIVTGGVVYLGTSLGSIMAIGVGDGSGTVIHAPRVPTATVPATPVVAAPPEPIPAASAASPIAGEPVEFVWETTGGDSGFAYPANIALAPDGTVWVADTGNDRFQLFSPDGSFLEIWGGPGSGEGEFHLQQTDGDGYGTAAFFPDGSFAVLDAGNLRIQVFGPDRNFQTSWGGIGADNGQFVEPIGIAIDAAGLIYVLDAGRTDVQLFSADGALQDVIKIQSTVSGTRTMNGLALDADGYLYVSEVPPDTSVPAIEKFDRDGNLVGTFGRDPGPGRFIDQPVSMAIDAAGNLFVTEIINNPRVVVFSPDGAYLTQFTAIGSSNADMELPFGVALDGAGSIYVTDANQNRLLKLRLAESLAPATPTP
jgi:outer membrane protein assembly factor BamB/sugar lactone lactonase YvrE